MKNLMIVAALALGTMTAIAQETETAVEEAGNEMEETATDAANATEEAATETYDAAEETATDAANATEKAAEESYDAAEDATQEAGEAVEKTAADATKGMQDGFNEVTIDKVPKAVTTALEKAHPGATVDKAYMNDEKQYKVDVTKEDGETAELYMDAKGNMIDM